MRQFGVRFGPVFLSKGPQALIAIEALPEAEFVEIQAPARCPKCRRSGVEIPPGPLTLVTPPTAHLCRGVEATTVLVVSEEFRRELEKHMQPDAVAFEPLGTAS